MARDAIEKHPHVIRYDAIGRKVVAIYSDNTEGLGITCQNELAAKQVAQRMNAQYQARKKKPSGSVGLSLAGLIFANIMSMMEIA